MSLDFSPTNTYMVVTTLSKKFFEISEFKQSITPNIFHQSKLKLGNTCEIQGLVFLFSLLCFSKSTKLWGSQVCLFNYVGFGYSFHLSSMQNPFSCFPVLHWLLHQIFQRIHSSYQQDLESKHVMFNFGGSPYKHHTSSQVMYTFLHKPSSSC